jgi:hypothetical protein
VIESFLADVASDGDFSIEMSSEVSSLESVSVSLSSGASDFLAPRTLVRDQRRPLGRIAGKVLDRSWGTTDMSSIEGRSGSFESSLFSFSVESVDSRGEDDSVEAASELKDVDDLNAEGDML